MIFQGIFNILDLYFTESGLLYDNIDSFFQKQITVLFKNNDQPLEERFHVILDFVIKELVGLGFDKKYLELKLADPFLNFRKGERDRIKNLIDLYEIKIAPIIYEVFLEKIVDYFVSDNVSRLILSLKSNGLIPLEYIIEMRELKSLLEENPNKQENLRRYVHIRDSTFFKFSESKCDIEDLEVLRDPKDRLQLTYLVFRIIDFFHMESFFNFSRIKQYLKENVDEWLVDVPLISLKNPDIYFCGIYLAKHFNLSVDDQKIKDFLSNLIEEAIDEFDSPLIEATDGTYYFLKVKELMDYKLTPDQLNKLFLADSKYFEPNYLKNLETSQLVVILKILNLYNYLDKYEPEKINAILNEIDLRMTDDGITQYRDGFISSEATYYVLFLNYFRDTLEKLEKYPLLDNIISRIFRNLEILDFCSETNNDLISELFYSCESLKLLNCIENKEMIIHLTKYLFPNQVKENIIKSEKFPQSDAKFRHLKVNKTTGETIY